MFINEFTVAFLSARPWFGNSTNSKDPVKDVIRCLNMLPAANSVSYTLSPQTIITGNPPPDYNKLQLEFGSYVQLFDDAQPTNTLRSRTFGAIALTPSGNATTDLSVSEASARSSRPLNFTLIFCILWTQYSIPKYLTVFICL